MFRFLIRPVLFLFKPEPIHHFIVRILSWSGSGALIRAFYGRYTPGPTKRILGLDFPNPVGIAAGFDKDAKVVDSLAAFGFGFVEIGTVTPKPQPGNPKPRIFRLKKDKALINRLGFNNGGVRAAAERLAKRKCSIIIGGNIGKNKDTPNEEAFGDYADCFESLYEHVDYFVLNVSSPNTPGLRELQEKEPLRLLLTQMKELAAQHPIQKPILLKISPDLSDTQLDDVIEILKATQTDGVIAANTTISREGLQIDHKKWEQIGPGGLSGAPLAGRSNRMIAYLRKRLGAGYPIIGSGGIMSAGDALDKIKAGADLVQIYTGFIYHGPHLIKTINQKLASR